MNRRDFLQSTGSVFAGLALSRALPALADTPSNEWRTFEVTTRVELLKPSGVSRIWLPAALKPNTPFQKTLADHANAEGGTAKFITDKRSGLDMVSATYPANTKPLLTLTSRVSLKNYSVDLSSPAKPPRIPQSDLDSFLQPTRYIPTDGVVKETALKATAGATTDIDKARAI